MLQGEHEKVGLLKAKPTRLVTKETFLIDFLKWCDDPLKKDRSSTGAETGSAEAQTPRPHLGLLCKCRLLAGEADWLLSPVTGAVGLVASEEEVIFRYGLTVGSKVHS